MIPQSCEESSDQILALHQNLSKNSVTDAIRRKEFNDSCGSEVDQNIQIVLSISFEHPLRGV